MSKPKNKPGGSGNKTVGKETFRSAEIEIVVFDGEDIITESKDGENYIELYESV